MRRARIPIPIPQNGHNCVQSAISILRVALGYNAPLPNIEFPDPVLLSWIVSNAQRFFPRHEVRAWGNGADSTSDWRDIPMGEYLFIFDYITPGRRRTIKRYHSHTVIGYPDLHDGMIGAYVIGVKTK